MGLLQLEGVTHWSIPVNKLAESEGFYGDLLGLKPLGGLGNSVMSCFNVGGHNILLCEREHPTDHTSNTAAVDRRTHHSFTVSPETFALACKVFHERHIPVDNLVYRSKGFFPGRELYFLDPSGNRLELRDQTWQQGMPEPS
ncbi:MAG: hypothetical protein EXR54_02055 [Dehalococcoidia bacterium]|nr:hypothetical protein [Dehalococcoidia bacterium]MSQ16343.1 hypothetical protein [Dehalococcoidia bacterium]